MPKYIFVVGGVMSGVGKGVSAAAIGKILQARGISVTAIKIDPYVNVDAGTMNPTEHGEVFVLDDGTECDQDMGNYERFLGKSLSGESYMTTGSVYQAVINRERSMGYGGKCVSVVPHIPLEVIDRVNRAAKKEKAELVIIEVGGTVGEYENILFLEAIRMLKLKNPEDVLLALVSYMPTLGAGGNEMKTKPTQHAVRNLNAAGLQPDFIFGRARTPLDQKRKEKIAFMCGLVEADVISAPDIYSIYDIPLNFEADDLSSRILKKLKLKPRQTDLQDWRSFVKKIHTAKKGVRIGIVGKYFDSGEFVLEDSYISVLEAVKHASAHLGLRPEIVWLNSEKYEGAKSNLNELKNFSGIIVPGGFGSRGVEGKIAAIRFCRENKIPYFGLCYGMQLAVVELARSIAGLRGANTTEVNPKTTYPIIDILPEQKSNLLEKKYGASMRLGAYPAELKPKSLAEKLYGAKSISERHRHRFEVNPDYISKVEAGGLIFSGASPDRRLMEVMELPQNIHPFFMGTQFHPELKSRPLAPHPLFLGFIKAASKKSTHLLSPRKKS